MAGPEIGVCVQRDGETRFTDVDGSRIDVPRQLRSTAELLGAVTGTCNALDRLEARLRSLLEENFRANARAAPLPPPFVIDVRDEDGERIASGSVTPEPRIRWRESGDEVLRPNHPVSIGLLEFGVAPAFRDRKTLRYAPECDSGAKEQITRAFDAALTAAVERKVAVVIGSELLLPRSAIPWLVARVKSTGVPVITGLEGTQLVSGFANEALVMFPRWTDPDLVRKIRPSVYEPSGVAMASGVEIPIYRGSRFGSFAVLICSDLLEADLVDALRRGSVAGLDLVVVPAWTPHPELHEAAATADAYRLYSGVAIVNGCRSSTSRSALFVPTAASPVSFTADVGLGVEDLGASPQPAVLRICQLDLEALAARSRGKPEKGFLAVPHCRRPIPYDSSGVASPGI